MKIVFSEYSQTFRIMPQNYWVASVKEDRLIFDSWDGMTKKILKKNPLLKLVVLYKFIVINLFK